MKALTIWQPWASFLLVRILGRRLKRLETRGYRTKIRGPLLIHAAKGFPKRTIHKLLKRGGDHYLRLLPTALPHLFPEGSDLLSLGDDALESLILDRLPRGGIIGTVNLVDSVPCTNDIIQDLRERRPWELAVGNFRIGRHLWIMSDPEVFDNPIPCKGRQGFWNFPMSISGRIIHA
jgi:hypothetical protein